jgi:hypothetical protein
MECQMGKPKHSNDKRGDQQGAQEHAEGQYGPKALAAKVNEITDHSRTRQHSQRELMDPKRGGRDGEAEIHEREMRDPSLRDGRHRIAEERKQHDEADRASEKNRLIADVETHHHERADFQIPHGRTRHPAAPEEPRPAIHSPGESGK